MMVLKLRLKEMWERNDLRKSQLAEFLHINVRTYSRYEDALVAPPLLVMARLAYFYGMVHTREIVSMANQQGMVN